MGTGGSNFTLRLVTSSNDVGLRRLRSLMAHAGGTAQVYSDPSSLHADALKSEHQTILGLDSACAQFPASQTALRALFPNQTLVVFNLSGAAASRELVQQTGDVVLANAVQPFLSSAFGRTGLVAALRAKIARSQVCGSDFLGWGSPQWTWQAAGSSNAQEFLSGVAKRLRFSDRQQQDHVRLVETISWASGLTLDHFKFSSDGVAAVSTLGVTSRIQLPSSSFDQIAQNLMDASAHGLWVCTQSNSLQTLNLSLVTRLKPDEGGVARIFTKVGALTAAALPLGKAG